MTAPLRLACINSEAPPLFHLAGGGQPRRGYEPAVGEFLAGQLGRPLHWVYLPWAEMIPSAQRGDVDGILCGQGITAERQQRVSFTRPYAVFNESVLVRRGAPVNEPGDLRGQRVAAITGSTNMTLAQGFPGAIPVGFGGGSDDVFGEMLAALRSGNVDAVVDDDVVCLPLGAGPDFDLAFTVRTGNRWGIGVAKDAADTLAVLDAALSAVIADGRLASAWQQWLPGLEYPFAAPVPG